MSCSLSLGSSVSMSEVNSCRSVFQLFPEGNISDDMFLMSLSCRVPLSLGSSLSMSEVNSL